VLSISCSAESFAVESNRRTTLVAAFDEIVRATAYKRDEITTDLLYVEIELANGESIALNEDMPGFNSWISRVETLPGVDAKWRAKVIHPPFARNETVLLTRRG
jgi:hypothetical protein